MVQNQKAPVYTTTSGNPVTNPYSSQQIGRPGPVLLQDVPLLDLLAHFDRERIPERVVHAKGYGAFGEFECTDDVSDLTDMAFLNQVGKKTPILLRFSTVGGESGSADSARDPRGFAMKLNTEEGNLDWVFNNTPVFFIRDPTKFVPFIHTQKRNPETHLKDPNMFWDYLTNNAESLHQVMILFSDRGTPKGVHMHGYSGHTYKWVKQDGTFHYVQVHLRCDQGFETLDNETATRLAGENPDFSSQYLYELIKRGEYPTWTAYVQTMTPEQAEKFDYSIFDLTKVWPHKEFPLRRFGKFTLNRNPSNYFAEIEQAAFSPGNTVPGWEASADPVLQSRLFSYADTHRHRLGPNFHQIPVNRSDVAFNPMVRDGPMNVDGNHGSKPNYPSSFSPVTFSSRGVGGTMSKASEEHEKWVGTASNFHWGDDGDYRQPAALWELYKRTGQDEALIHNVAGHAGGATPGIQQLVIEYFSKASPEIGERLSKALPKASKAEASELKAQNPNL